MHLTKKQQKVLHNTLAWTDYNPSDEDIETFFAYSDKGIKIPSYAIGAMELLGAWTTHYSDPFKPVVEYAKGQLKNCPIIPPAAWIYDAYFGPPVGFSWVSLLKDFVLDCIRDQHMFEREHLTWERIQPAYTLAYRLAAYFHERLSLEDVRSREW